MICCEKLPFKSKSKSEEELEGPDHREFRTDQEKREKKGPSADERSAADQASGSSGAAPSPASSPGDAVTAPSAKPKQETGARSDAVDRSGRRAKKGGFHWGRIIFLVILVFLLLAGAVYGAYWYWGQSDKLSKEERLVQAAVSYLRADSVTSSTEASFLLGGLLELEVGIDSQSSVGQELEDTLASVEADVHSVFKQGDSSEEYDIKVKTRLVDGVAYFLLEEVPSMPFYDSAQIEEGWIRQSDIKKADQRGAELNFDEDVIQLIEDRGVEVLKLAQQTGFLTLAESSEVSEVGGEPVYAYQLDLHPRELPGFLRQSADQLPDNDQADQLRATAQKIEDNWERFTNSIQMEDYTVPMTVAVTQDNYLPKLISSDVSFRITDKTFQHLSEQESARGSLSWKSEFHSIGEPIAVEAPADSRSLSEVFNFGTSTTSLFSGSQEVADDARIKSWLSQIKVTAEMYFTDNDRSYMGVCQQSDLLSLLEEAVAESPSDRAAAEHCLDSEDGWIVLVPLNKEEEKSYCVDYLGTVRAGASAEKPEAAKGYQCSDY